MPWPRSPVRPGWLPTLYPDFPIFGSHRNISFPATKRKMLVSLIPPFESVPPIRELRVGEYRILYDVDEGERKVYVRAVRKKPPHKTSEEII